MRKRIKRFCEGSPPRGAPGILCCSRKKDRHTAGESRQLTRELDIEVRWLPRATPELNAMDQLWKHVKRDALANRPTRSIEASADAACRHILQMRGQERLRRAGVLSGNFWLRA